MDDMYEITQEPKMDDSNKRLFERVHTDLSARLLDLADFDEKSVTVCDFSAGGLGMYSFEPVVEGSVVKMWVNIPDRKRELFLEGTVKWVQQHPDKGWVMGINFSANRMFDYKRLLGARQPQKQRFFN
jgi:hypothetical protein